MSNLKAQKRMAMEIMKVGQRGCWLDPSKMNEIAKVKTRAGIRDLIEQGVIRRARLRDRQGFVMPPQYMSRFRQRLLCDPKVRYRDHHKKRHSVDRPKPTSGKRYLAHKYWKPKPNKKD